MRPSLSSYAIALRVGNYDYQRILLYKIGKREWAIMAKPPARARFSLALFRIPPHTPIIDSEEWRMEILRAYRSIAGSGISSSLLWRSAARGDALFVVACDHGVRDTILNWIVLRSAKATLRLALAPESTGDAEGRRGHRSPAPSIKQRAPGIAQIYSIRSPNLSPSIPPSHSIVRG